MKKLMFMYLLMSQSYALEVMDQPDKNANMLIIGDASTLKVLDDSYIHVMDPKTKVSGYVKYSDYQAAIVTSGAIKKFPQLSGVINKQEVFKDKAALLAQNIKNKQAQLQEIQKRLY